MHRLVPLRAQEMAERGEHRESTPGAALIVDVEGSTALSARLQPYGTVGAEAFADILSALFRPMVKWAVTAGGSVSDLPGDGIVATFPGDPSSTVADAMLAAAGIMDDLGRLADFETPDGTASLSVRCCVGAGSVDWVVWTSDDPDAPQNATYACLGSAVDEARRGEAITPGGVISVGPTAVTHLPPEMAGADLVEGYVSADPTVGKLRNRVQITDSATPAAIRFYPDSVLESDVRAEFRDVVAVFLELSDAAANYERMDRALNSITRYQGYLNSVTGTSPGGVRMLALWGAPTSHEHDIGYGLRFIDELRAEFGPDVRAGVTRSTAFTGLIGGLEREVYTAIGPGVNLAARMCASAQPGEIRIDQGVAARLTEPWGTEDLGEIDYRGMATPISTARVTNTPPIRVPEPYRGPLVGRHSELDQLEDLAAPLWTGRAPGVIAVAGEPGVGKSRLIAALEDRLAERSPPPIWIHARADEINSQPLATLRDALTGYFGRPGTEESSRALDGYLKRIGKRHPDRAAELNRTRGTFGDLLQLPDDVANAEKLDPRARFDNVAIALGNLIASLEQTNPVIIAISDSQWMDSGTTDILKRLTADLPDKRVAVLLETREPGQGLDHDHLVEVTPLGESDIAKLAEGVLDGTPSPELVSALAERSGGNPFFVEQLLDYLKQEGATDDPARVLDAFGRSGDLPLDVRRILVARLDSLFQDVRRLTQTGSVLGRDVDLGILRQMVADDDFEVLVQMAIAAGIWHRLDVDHVRFSNLMIRDAAYGMLLHSETTGLHGDAARAIEATDQPRDAELAYHYDNAGNRDEAAAHHLAAGRTAARSYANRQAHLHLQRALELMPDDDYQRRFEALRTVHDLFDVEGNRTAQADTLSLMERLVDDDPARDIELALLRARYLAALGEYTEANDVVEAAMSVASASDFDAERGQLEFLRAQLARYQGAIDEAVAYAGEARHLFAAAGDDLLLAKANDFAGGIAWESGDFDEAVELHRSAADMFTTAGRTLEEVAALNNLGSVIFSMGDYARAREIHREGAELSREIGYRMGEGDHLDNMGGTAWAVGDLDLALDLYSEALQIRQSMDDSWGIAISLGNLGATHRAKRDPGEALSLYRQALEIDRRIGRKRGEAYDLHGIGLCHIDLGRYNLATESLRASARIRENLSEQHLANESHVACAQAMLRAGDPVGAAALVETVLETEGDEFFTGAVETTSTRLRCIEVLEATAPELAVQLIERTREGVLRRAELISDPAQQETYLNQVESHSRATGGR